MPANLENSAVATGLEKVSFHSNAKECSNYCTIALNSHASTEKAMASHSSTLSGKSHGWICLVGYSPWGHKELDTTEQLHFTSLHFFGTGMKTDLFQCCGHCWAFQICWHIECSTFTVSSFENENESESSSVVSDSLRPHGQYSPWNSPGQNTGVCSLSLLQGIFPTQGTNPGLPLCRQIFHQLSHQGSPMLVEAASKKSKRSAREAITKTEAKHNPPWCFLWPLGRKAPCLLKSSSTSWL